MIRWIFGGLFLLTAGVAAYLIFTKNTVLAAKFLWLAAAAILFVIYPERFLFFASSSSGLLIVRNVFGLISIFLLVVDLFAIFWIQLPSENSFPRYHGVVTAYAEDPAQLPANAIPRVEYSDDKGNRVSFLDNYAKLLFPGQIFKIGDKVEIIVPDLSHAHIEKDLISRWDTIIFLSLLVLISASVAAVSQMRYNSIGD